jgi:sugar lactone lactonase YvrE
MKKVIVVSLLFMIALDLNLNGQIITTIAGGVTGHGGYWGDGGPATAAQFGSVPSIAIDALGNIYIADGANQRIRKVDAITNVITTVAGTGVAGYFGDGGMATNAKLNAPDGVCVDNLGNFYIMDVNNYRVRKVDVSTGIISTFVGNGIHGYMGDGVPATATAIYGNGFCSFDNIGNMYLSDVTRIRKVDVSGVITTIAGTGLHGTTGEGVPATATNISPNAISCDVSGNVYFSDTTNSIRKITVSSGIIARIAGTGDNVYSPYSGDGTSATVCHIGPEGVFVDQSGNVYVADIANSRVEKIAAAGVIYTIAGNGTTGFSGDGGPATAAAFYYVEDVRLDDCGNVFIADFGNARVRKVTYPPILTTPTISLSGASSYPAGSTVTVTATVGSAGGSYLIHWLNHDIEFTTTTVPSVTYTKPPGTDTITARIVPTGWGCWDSTTSSQHIVSTDVTGVSSISEPWCMVYPNPAHTTLTAATHWNEGTLTIYNTIGQTVLAKQFYKRGIPVNVGNLPAGIYLLKITGAENETVITRFIKQ